MQLRPFRPFFRHSVFVIALFAISCSGADDNAAPVATPTVTIGTKEAAIGSPIEMQYRFVVPPDAPAINGDYIVFVHFVDTDGELMWTDDHEPPTPVRQWKPGATVEYTRTMFIPKFPYVGQTRVEVGLYSPSSGDRLPMTGQTRGQRAYDVASFEMRLQSDNLFVIFRDGWHATEVTGESTGLEWQWSRKDATHFRSEVRSGGANAGLRARERPGGDAARLEPQREECRRERLAGGEGAIGLARQAGLRILGWLTEPGALIGQ